MKGAPMKEHGQSIAHLSKGLRHRMTGGFVCPDDKPPQFGPLVYDQHLSCSEIQNSYAHPRHHHPAMPGQVFMSAIVPYSHKDHLLGPLVD